MGHKHLPTGVSLLAIIGTIVVCIMLWLHEKPRQSTKAEIDLRKQREQTQARQIVAKSKKIALHEKPHKPTTISTHQSGTVEKLQYEVKRVLGSSNRGIARIYKIEETSENIKIVFTINDNLTNGMIKTSSKIDIRDILKAVQSSGYDYSEVVIFGTFPLVDKYGNSEESTVLKVSYTPTTVNKINWQNFLYDNVYEIADSAWLHPTFR